MTIKEIHTNKAKIIFKKNGTVEKIFFDSTAAENEIKSLKGLNDAFIDKELDGWLYKAVRVVEYDAGKSKIVMNRVEGVNFSQIFDHQPEYVYHMGIWLAVFHNYVRKEKEKLMLYGDFNRGNFIIDKENKEVTAIDPGSYFGEIGYPEMDIVTTIYSLVVGSLKKLRSPYKITNDFVKAYSKQSDKKISKENMKKSWETLKARFKNKYKKSHLFLRPIAYVAMVLLNSYMTILIKKLVD